MKDNAIAEENAQSARPAYKRKIIVVNRFFQFKHAVISLVLFGLAAFIVWWETFQSISGLAKSGMITDPSMMPLLKEISRVVMIKVIIALGLVWMLSILITHFIAGPIYRLQKGLEALRDGDLNHRIHLRRGDDLKAVAALFNDTMDTVQSRLNKSEAEIQKIADQLEKEGGAGSKGIAQNLRYLATRLLS